jgi:hypothetical protein
LRPWNIFVLLPYSCLNLFQTKTTKTKTSLKHINILSINKPSLNISACDGRTSVQAQTMGKRKGGASSESPSDDDMPVALSMCGALSRVERFHSRLTLMFFATLRLRLPLYVWCPSHSAPGVDAE